MQQLNLEQATRMLHTAPIGVLLLNAERQITWANDICHSFLGVAAGSLHEKNFAQLSATAFQRVVGQDGVYYVAANTERPERWLQCRDQRMDGGEAKYFTDITELRRVQSQQERIAQQLQELATMDPSTGLFTSRALMQNLDPLVSRSRRYNNPLSVVVLSVSGLAEYNARPSGPKAQQVLLAVGHMLKDQLRWADIISRSADDEFIIVLPETTCEQAEKLVDKIRTHLVGLAVSGKPDESDNIAARFGVAGWQKGDDAQQLLLRGHNALA